MGTKKKTKTEAKVKLDRKEARRKKRRVAGLMKKLSRARHAAHRPQSQAEPRLTRKQLSSRAPGLKLRVDLR